MNSHSRTRLQFLGMAMVSGALSGLLTAEAARYLDPTNPLLGAIFGVVLTLLLWRQQKSFSIVLPVLLISSCIAAYLIATYGSLFITELLNVSFGAKDSFVDLLSAKTFLIAGFIGALIINVAVLLLIRVAKGPRLLAIAAAWACVGAVLAVCAFELNAQLGTAVATIVGAPPTMDTGSTDRLYHAFNSAYLVWQTGMMAAGSLMLPQQAASATEQPSRLGSPFRFSIPGNIFFAGIFALLLYLGYSAGAAYYRKWQFDHESNKLVREIPSVQNLPAVTLKPLEQVLIQHDIAGYSLTQATAQNLPPHRAYVGVKGTPQDLAQRIIYSAQYQKTGPAQALADPSKTTVTVSELPNTGWAQFEVKNGPPNDAGPYLYMTSARQMKFGNSVLMHKSQEPNLCAFWPSSTNVVVVCYPGKKAEEIVRLYLEKYPSSL